MAYVCCIISNLAQAIHGKKGSGTKYTPMDFMPPWFKNVEQGQSIEVQKRILLDIANSVNKKAARKKR